MWQLLSLYKTPLSAIAAGLYSFELKLNHFSLLKYTTLLFLAQEQILPSFLRSFPCFSLTQRKATKENIGCKFFAINSALRLAMSLILM
jgi:hypothetical protein